MSLLNKCKAYRSQPNATTFPELPTVTTWMRFLLGGLYGISLGLRTDTRGLIGALFGLNVITFLPMFWFNSYLDANIDSYKSLNFAGVANAFAFMMLVWILIFTWEHGEEEISLGKVISDVVHSGSGDDGAFENVLTTESDIGHADLSDEF
ncbi:hypothetical protein HJC23_010715 [Cyclotella cryptica]|uniref:Uncharacterized protein n=1 Tax=Cyclotella cryptica TaxID=29204 RepID=A0ABD3PFU5_9STRA|eukprot:CCRYP_015453-RA/>CCRYP_015453-RA protein AED:0.28 eAED:0.28 QI:0/-1/0/1/-1/1/1/0/150